MIDLGETQYVLGIKLLHDRNNKKIRLSQVTYLDKMLVRHFMQDSEEVMLPFKHEIPLFKYQCTKTIEEEESMKVIPYASITYNLVHVILCTILDIWYVVGIVSKYKANLD